MKVALVIPLISKIRTGNISIPQGILSLSVVVKSKGCECDKDGNASLVPVPQHCREDFHVGVFFEVPEEMEIQQKKADGIEGKTDQAILMGHNGTDKREIYQ